MDQTALPVTAPNNPDPRWPEGYVAVLREARAQAKTIYTMPSVSVKVEGTPNA